MVMNFWKSVLRHAFVPVLYFKDSPSPPAPADPAVGVNAQAEANRLNLLTPTGTATFGTTDSSGAFLPLAPGSDRIDATTVNIAESPEQAAIRQQQEALTLGSLGNLPTGGIDLSGLPSLNTDFSGESQRLADAFLQQQLDQLNPEFARRSEALDQKLANQGLPLGSEAFNEATTLENEAQNRAITAAGQQAQLIGADERARLFQQALAGRQQGVAETTGTRAQLFNELASLLGNQQVSSNLLPNANVPAVDAVTPFALQQQGLNNAFTAQAGNVASQNQALGSLGSAALLAFL